MTTKIATPTVQTTKATKPPNHSQLCTEPLPARPVHGNTSLEEVRLGIESGRNICDNPEVVPALDSLRIGSEVRDSYTKQCKGVEAKKLYIGSKAKNKDKSASAHASNDSGSTSSVALRDSSVKDNQEREKSGAGGLEKTRDVDVTSSEVVDTEASWRLLSDVETLRRTKCRRLYAQSGRSEDLALFYRQGKFYCMAAWCSHMGGPLHEGDMEDYNGRLHVMCPWHAYMFDVDTGMSDIGLKQDVFPVKVEDGQVFVLCSTGLSLSPYLSL